MSGPAKRTSSGRDNSSDHSGRSSPRRRTGSVRGSSSPAMSMSPTTVAGGNQPQIADGNLSQTEEINTLALNQDQFMMAEPRATASSPTQQSMVMRSRTEEVEIPVPAQWQNEQAMYWIQTECDNYVRQQLTFAEGVITARANEQLSHLRESMNNQYEEQISQWQANNTSTFQNMMTLQIERMNAQMTASSATATAEVTEAYNLQRTTYQEGQVNQELAVQGVELLAESRMLEQQQLSQARLDGALLQIDDLRNHVATISIQSETNAAIAEVAERRSVAAEAQAERNAVTSNGMRQVADESSTAFTILSIAELESSLATDSRENTERMHERYRLTVENCENSQLAEARQQSQEMQDIKNEVQKLGYHVLHVLQKFEQPESRSSGSARSSQTLSLIHI